MNTVTVIEPKAATPVGPVAITPMDMLNQAVASGAGLEMVEKLMGLQERWEKNQARKAFDQAIAAAKAEIPVIERNRPGHNGRYADFAALATVVDPIIHKHGLHYRFRSVQADKISVTCILSHDGGHFEENSLSGPADTTGNKNAIQAIGSTLTYLQRYALTQALGLAVANDDDGKAAGNGELVTEEQVIALREYIESIGADEKKLLVFLKVEKLADMTAAQHRAAKDALDAWKKKAAR